MSILPTSIQAHPFWSCHFWHFDFLDGFLVLKDSRCSLLGLSTPLWCCTGIVWRTWRGFSHGNPKERICFLRAMKAQVEANNLWFDQTGRHSHDAVWSVVLKSWPEKKPCYFLEFRQAQKITKYDLSGAASLQNLLKRSGCHARLKPLIGHDTLLCNFLSLKQINSIKLWSWGYWMWSQRNPRGQRIEYNVCKQNIVGALFWLQHNKLRCKLRKLLISLILVRTDTRLGTSCQSNRQVSPKYKCRNDSENADPPVIFFRFCCVVSGRFLEMAWFLTRQILVICFLGGVNETNSSCIVWRTFWCEIMKAKIKSSPSSKMNCF